MTCKSPASLHNYINKAFCPVLDNINKLNNSNSNVELTKNYLYDIYQFNDFIYGTP